LAKSPLIQGGSLQELLQFFAIVSSAGSVKNNTIDELLNYVSLNTQPAASAIA